MIFVLLNEFLIYMAAKFLANCNLNLLLTKYYKKILISQLKDEESQIYAYTTSTKPIDNS